MYKYIYYSRTSEKLKKSKTSTYEALLSSNM